jgi:hypothetical protein
MLSVPLRHNYEMYVCVYIYAHTAPSTVRRHHNPLSTNTPAQCPNKAPRLAHIQDTQFYPTSPPGTLVFFTMTPANH